MKKLVLVHGWGVNSQIWNDILPQLEEHFEVTLIDLPGYGDDHDYFEDYSLETVSDEVLRRAPLEPAVWVAWSLGATIAIDAAIRHPDRFLKLQLISATPCYASRNDWQHGTLITNLNKLREDVNADCPSALGKFTLLQTLGSQDKSKIRSNLRLSRGLRMTFAKGKLPRKHVLLAGLDILEETDLRARLGELTVPTQVVSGEKDYVVPVEASDYLFKHLPNGHSRKTLSANHLPFLQCPTDYISTLLSFVNEPED